MTLTLLIRTHVIIASSTDNNLGAHELLRAKNFLKLEKKCQKIS
jgi:hypothetical protein